jgi:hypothetical protein
MLVVSESASDNNMLVALVLGVVSGQIIIYVGSVGRRWQIIII